MPSEIARAFVMIDGPSTGGADTFPARVLADTWNGWARPVFTDAVMEDVAEWCHRAYAEAGDGPILCRDRDGRWCETSPAEWEQDARRGWLDPASWAWSYLPVMPDGGVMIDGWCWTVLACDACGEVHGDSPCPPPVPAGTRADAYRVGHARGWAAAAYADAYGREDGDDTPSVPEQYADTIGSYALGYSDGWDAFGEDADD